MNETLTRDAQNQILELSRCLQQLLSAPVPEKSLIRLEQPMPAINLLGWLSHQSQQARTYWQDRDKEQQRMGLGLCWSRTLKNRNDLEPAFSEARELIGQLDHPEKVQCFSYLSFSDDKEQVWSNFGYGVVYLPILDVVETRKGTTLGINLLSGSRQQWRHSIRNAQALVDNLSFAQSLSKPSFQIEPEHHCPDYRHWQSMMQSAHNAFDSGALDKVVLSRESIFSIYGNICPWYLMQCWQRANPNSYHFVFENASGEYFVGCSPEKLIKRQGRIITSEALAGTSRRGKTREEDIQLELLLMNDDKNIHENRLVLDDIRQQLSPLCQSLETDRSHSVLKLKTIQHLRYLVRGVLQNHISDARLIEVMHPTPAVGGKPRAGSRQFIDRNEPYKRGLYAGACGVLGLESSEFSVSIRSARIAGDRLSLFAGAGIVRDSNCQDEWQELDNKITTVLTILKETQAAPVPASQLAAGRLKYFQH